MMLSLNQLITTFPKHIWLDVSAQAQAEACQQVQGYSNDVARWNAYVNYLCLNTFVSWIQEEPDLQDSPLVWPHRNALPSIWEVVNGTAIGLGQTRLVLIPSETTDIDKLCVPKEWVDIPSWAAEYYLAVQMNLEGDDCWIRVWGFTTYQKLRKGRYDSVKRTYSLERKDLIESLNAMWVARELCPEEKPVVEPLPTLSSNQAERLLEQLSQKTPYFPQLEVPFEEWGALLANDEWRQQLYNRRVVPAVAPSKKPVDLGQWLRNVVESGRNLVEEGWQTFEAFFASLEPSPVRGKRGSDLTSPDAIASVIRLLELNQPEQTRRQAAGVLGEIGAGNSDAINALTELLHTAKDEETRWQAALSLGKIDPGNPQAGIRKARLIDLGMQLGGHAVALVVAIMPKADGRIGVFLQVQPHSETKLPPHLKLSVLSESGSTRLEAAARSDDEGRGKDESIQLRFSPPSGTRFRVKVTRDDVSVAEDFVA